MKRLKQWIMYHLVCKRSCHIWEGYMSTGYYDFEVEQACYCTRCGFDTHGEYEIREEEA